MELVYGVLIAIFGIGTIMILRLVTTLFHEMGHAIPALLFTNKQVEVYIGSYGNIDDNSFFKFGRLEMYFKWDLLQWQIGMCRHMEKIESTIKNVLVILGGPIASLLISIPLIINLKSIYANELLFFLSIIFIASAIIDLVVNLIPFSSGMRMHDGGAAFSDGYLLLSIFSRSIKKEKFFEFENNYQDEEYELVIKKGKEYLQKDRNNRFVYNFMIQSFIKLNRSSEALDCFTQLKQIDKLDNEDYFQIGTLYNKIGEYDEALKFLNHSFHYNFSDPAVTNQMGYAHLELGNTHEALKLFSETISKSPQFVLAYINRARLLISMDEYEAAGFDLHNAKILEDKNPNLYFYLGLIKERQGHIKEAVAFYEQAKELGCERHGLDYKIETL